MNFYNAYKKMFLTSQNEEMSQAIARLVFFTLFTTYLFIIKFFINSEPITLPFLFLLTIGPYVVIHFLWVKKYPKTNVNRKIIAIVVDVTSVSLAVLLLEWSGLFLFSVYIWIIVGNGMRFGAKYLFFAMGITLLQFSSIVLYNNFWIQQQNVAYGLIITIVILPLFFLVMIQRIKSANAELMYANKKNERYLKLIDENIISSTTDLDGVITDASQAFCQLTGYSKEELLGQNHRIFKDIYADTDKSMQMYKEMWDNISTDHIWSGEVKNRKKDGEYYWISTKIFPTYDENENKIGYLAIRQNITDKKHIESLSITDELTQLFNRRHFNAEFQKEINRSRREKSKMAFIMLDIDYFKQYNDTYGHQKGDDVLQIVAQTIKTYTNRGGDNAFRLGGEEFGIIFIANNERDVAEHIKTLIKAVEDLKIEHRESKTSNFLTISAGMLFHDFTKEMNSEEFYRLADQALYRAKENGRNQLSLYSTFIGK